jgi:2-haloacid dehalogenase
VTLRNVTKPKAIVFDLGKVLVDFDYSVAARKIAAQGTLPAAEVQKLIDHSPLLFRFETGQMNKEEFFSAVCSATGFHGSLEEFRNYFVDIFIPIQPMVEMHARLRASRIPTFILSNTNELAVAHIRQCFPFFRAFDGYVLSYEHGSMKPAVKLYEVVEATTGCAGAELFYLDDRPENIQTAAKRGWQVLLHETPDKTLSAMRAAGLPV